MRITWSVDGETLIGTRKGEQIRFVLIPAPGVDRVAAMAAIKRIARTANRESRRVPIRESILTLLRDEPEGPWTATLLSSRIGCGRSGGVYHLGKLVEEGLVVVDREGPTKKGYPVRLATAAQIEMGSD